MPETSKEPLALVSEDDPRAVVYTRLRPWQTRLVELFPSSHFDDPLECILHVGDVIAGEGLGLSDQWRSQAYEAISYSWGRPELTSPVICNGQRINIPPPLAKALQYLRYSEHENRSRWLWCDAICINQADDAEKSHQVNMMMAIFSKAKRVTAWLGELDESSQFFFDSANRSSEEEQTTSTSEDGWSEDFFGVTDRNSEAERRTSTSNDDKRKQLHFNNFFSRPWFSRTWVRQEVYAANALILQAGTQELAFSKVKATMAEAEEIPNLKVLLQHYRNSPDRESSSIPEGKIPQGFRYAQEVSRILLDGVSFNVSDSRDRVYGLLGILNDLPERRYWNQKTETYEAFDEMKADYRKGLSIVYEDTTKYLINLANSLWPLEVIRPPRLTEELPGWVIDWRTDRPSPPLRMPSSSEPLRPPSYNDEWYWKSPFIEQDLQSHGSLTVRGIFLGNIGPLCVQRVTELYDGIGLHTKEYKDFLEHLNEFLQNGYCKLSTIELVPSSSRTDRVVSPIYIGGGVMISGNARLGDKIYSLQGSEACFILRPLDERGRFRMIGPGYFWRRSSETTAGIYTDITWFETTRNYKHYVQLSDRDMPSLTGGCDLQERFPVAGTHSDFYDHLLDRLNKRGSEAEILRVV